MVNRRGDCGWQDAGAWAPLAKRGPLLGAWGIAKETYSRRAPDEAQPLQMEPKDAP